jgi:hypothetical protein
MTSRELSSLRAILALDALACLGMGAGLAALAPALAGLTDLPSAFVRAAGLALLPVGASYCGRPLAATSRPGRWR